MDSRADSTSQPPPGTGGAEGRGGSRPGALSAATPPEDDAKSSAVLVARVLLAVGVAAALSGMAYLAWRWASPSECAWTSPAAADWLGEGVRPTVTDQCALRPGTTVTGARVHGATVDLLRGAADPVTLPLVPSGPLVLHRLLAATASLAFCAGFFALSLYAALRRRSDRDAATTVVFSGALLGSTVVTMVGLPAHSAFEGPARWASMLLTEPLYLLAWGAGLAWLLLFPAPLAGLRRSGSLWAAALVGPAVLWAAIVVPVWAAADSFTGWMRASIVVQSSLTVTALGASIAILIIRLRTALRAEPASVPREQLLWVSGSAAVAGLLSLSLWMVPQLLTGHALLPGEAIGAPGLLFVAGFGIAILRYRMFDLDTVLARTLVYAGLTLAAVLVYLITTALLAAGLGTLAPAQVAVIGAVLAALVVNPLRVRLERRVNRAFYGDRDDPYTALSRVATKVTERGVADERVAEDIRKALRSPYVRITRADGPAVQSGEPSALVAGSVDLPLEHAGATMGALQVAVRGTGERYGPGERRLLADIARQIGTGLHEARLVGELQRSRERIVSAREEERRALRRVLHDEAGPTMASVSLRAETVRRLLRACPETARRADPLLAEISADASTAAEGLRQLAYDLRPPALDEHGLARALSQYAAGVTRPRVTVTADLEGAPGRAPLSAAVEAAVYRIAVAAVANAVRHADARTCSITLTRSDREVQVTIADDGSGLPPGYTRGVGITAMMERAAELGGECRVGEASPGTVVHAVIPTGAAP